MPRPSHVIETFDDPYASFHSHASVVFQMINGFCIFFFLADGIVYGQGAAALAKRLDVSDGFYYNRSIRSNINLCFPSLSLSILQVSVAEAAALRASFLQAYTGITGFIEGTIESCRTVCVMIR